MRPSSVEAHFASTKGRPAAMDAKNFSFCSAARRRHGAGASTTSMPARRSAASPRPDTSGFGSFDATTTRRTPAAITTGAHGGVRPWWVHGSSVR